MYSSANMGLHMAKAKKSKYFRGDEGRQRLVALALGLVEGSDRVSLTFQLLADEARVTRAAPMHLFGGSAGLHAAVGAEGFARLAAALNSVPTCATGLEQLVALTMAHARFGLEHPNLYREMHHPDAWAVANEPSSAGPQRQRSRAHALAAVLLRSRAESLAIFAGAAARASRDGSLRLASDEIGEATHLLTTLTDGFLFQAREERVMEGRSLDQQLESFRWRVEFVAGALGGEVGRAGIGSQDVVHPATSELLGGASAKAAPSPRAPGWLPPP